MSRSTWKRNDGILKRPILTGANVTTAKNLVLKITTNILKISASSTILVKVQFLVS